MLTTNDDSVWERAWSFRDHGTATTLPVTATIPGDSAGSTNSFGTNWRLTEMQSAIGRAQLQKLSSLDSDSAKKCVRFDRKTFRCPGLRVTTPSNEIDHSYYKYYVFVRPERLREGWDRRPNHGRHQC